MSYNSPNRSVECGKINIRTSCHRTNMTLANTKISLNILRNPRVFFFIHIESINEKEAIQVPV